MDDLTMDGQVAAAAVDKGNDFNSIGNGYIANDLANPKKAVGGVYQCLDCGNDYTAKVTWQKYCPSCSQERKKGVLRAKAKLKAVNG
jgi:hypothetical protein